MHNVTSTLLNALHGYGHLPALDSGNRPGDVLITAEVGGGTLSFYCEAERDRVRYKLAFQHAKELNKEDVIRLYRIFRTDCSTVFSSIGHGDPLGEIALMGERSRREMTPIFIEYIMEEAVSLQTVFKIRELVEADAPEQKERNS